MELTIDSRLIPPMKRLPAHARQGDFRKQGTSFVRLAADHGLQPADRVLDLGCGAGRFAAAFAAYADETASYVGLDVARDSIDLCNEYMGSALPNFEFQTVDVYNGRYNPKATQDITEYHLPYEDASFDFVFSHSLFTHLMQADTEVYIREIGRVLRPGSEALNTFFLLNEISISCASSLDDPRGVPHVYNEEPLIRVGDPNQPEARVAYDERFIRGLHSDAGLDVTEPVRYGSWSGRESTGPGLGNQDIVFALRR